MRAALRSISAAGLGIFLAVAIASFASPRFFERQAKQYLVERLRSEALELYPALGAVDKELLSALCRHDCADEARLSLVRAAIARLVLEDRLHRLEQGLERVKQWAQGRFDGMLDKLLRDVRIFALTNALMFLLAFLMASVDPPTRAVKVISAALIASATLGTLMYVFGQNWLQTILFSSYAGGAYVVWVALIVAGELDVLLNRGRVLAALMIGVVDHYPD